MWSSPLSMSIAVLSPMCIRTDFSSQIAKTEPGGIWRKITADARTPKMPYFQGFPHLFASKTQWKSESESLLRFRRVLTDFRESLLEFLIEPSDFSPQNHAFGSAWKAPVMPNRTKSCVGKCRVGIKTAVIGKNISKADFKWLIFADNVACLRCNRDKCNTSIFNSWLKNIVFQVIVNKKSHMVYSIWAQKQVHFTRFRR